LKAGDFKTTVVVESYILTVVFLALAVISWFVFYHHPSHIGVKISSKGQNWNYSLNTDKTNKTSEVRVENEEDLETDER